MEEINNLTLPHFFSINPDVSEVNSFLCDPKNYTESKYICSHKAINKYV